MVRTGRNMLIVDAYNANPVSMKAALANLGMIVSEKKAVMLGDMLELGDDSVQEHEAILGCLADIHPDKAFLVGSEFKAALDRTGYPEFVRWFEDSSSLAGYLAANGLDGYAVLIKGSRGIRMEKVIPVL